tara:strand:- start:1840 stop:2571 length:732 start_codon:yes stop_codon:yes gene_type:complete
MTRRTGNTIPVPGDYHFRAVHEGLAPQRFWHKERFAASLEALGPQPNLRILDVGCGSGLFADQAAKLPGSQVVGVDANEAAIEFATKTFARENLSFRLGMLDELDLEPGSFDRISLLEVIEHVYEDQARVTLADFHRLLAPGGQLVISTPNMRSAWPLIEWVLDRTGTTAQMAGEMHVAGYTPASLERLCEEAGFRLLTSSTLFVVSPWLSLASRRLARLAYKLERASPVPLGSLIVQSFERV